MHLGGRMLLRFMCWSGAVWDVVIADDTVSGGDEW